jgi:hypothetical protein
MQPSIQPSMHPSKQPSVQPTNHPSQRPTSQPTKQPQSLPTRRPTGKPSTSPTVQPTTNPSTIPSLQPSLQPTSCPSSQPSAHPSLQPYRRPSSQPTIQPSSKPSNHPSSQPSSQPSRDPTKQPTSHPSHRPTSQPTSQPTSPTSFPTAQPSSEPTSSTPTCIPSSHPLKRPTTSKPIAKGQTINPSSSPTSTPSSNIYDYQPQDSYKFYEDTKLTYQSIPDSFSYSQYYYKGDFKDGSCENWNSFIVTSLMLPFDEIYFKSITASFVTDTFEKNVDLTYSTATCSNILKISKLISYLQSKQSGDENCDGYLWRVFTCKSKPVVCVNCKVRCANTVSCPGKSNIFNPCNDQCNFRIAAGASINFKYDMHIFYPQFNHPLYIMTTNSSISVSVTTSVAGNIYCAAFSPGLSLSTVLTIKAQGVSNYSMNENSNLQLTIVDLCPDTAYAVYCYTEDFLGHSMPLSEAIDYTQSVSTKCCREIVLLSSISNIPQYFQKVSSLDKEPVFVLGLNSRPTDLLTVTLSIRPCKGTSAIASVVPTSLAFNHNSVSLIGNFLVRSTTAGCYILKSQSTSSSGSDIYINFESMITVASNQVSPLPPVPIYANFTNDGTQIMLIFDSPTDRGATVIFSFAFSFKCGLIIDFAGASQSVCKWNSATVLVATLGNAVILPFIGSTIQLKKGMIRAVCMPTVKIVCSLYDTTSQSNVKINAPSNPVQPNPQLLAASTVNYCDDIYLHPEGSSGFAGRQWESVIWSVYDFQSRIEELEISYYLNSVYNETSKVVTVPNHLLRYDTQYLFRLSVENFLGQSGIASVLVSVGAIGFLMPQISNLGPSSVNYRWGSISLYASVSLPSCINSTSISISYSWNVYKGYIYNSSLTSKSLDPRYFKLDPYTLDAASKYSFLAKASITTDKSSDILLSGSTKYSIQIGVSGVRAKIAGPSEIVSNVSTALILDASRSVDIDYPDSLEHLIFHWSCIELSPDYGSSCSKYISDSSVIRLDLPSGRLRIGVFRFSVDVTNKRGSSSQAQALITTTKQIIPFVTISSVAIKYNPYEKIILNGIVTGSQTSISAIWSSPAISGEELEAIVASPLQGRFPAGSSIFQLSLKPYFLTAGLTYKLVLNANFNNQIVSGSSTVFIVINSQPSGGRLLIQPLSGIALTTIFEISTFSWTDDADDMPLSYTLSYYVSDQMELLPIKTMDAVPWSNSVLGSGLDFYGNKIVVVAFAIDRFGAEGNTTRLAQVLPIKVTGNLEKATRSSLTAAFRNKDSSAIIQIVSATVNTLNEVDCSADLNCIDIKRQECQHTANTCGPCLSGYLGVSGDSNIPCKLVVNLVRTGGNCSNGSSCYTGVCDRGFCKEIDKSCPNACSERGKCIFFNSNYERVANCSVSNKFCEPKCDCYSGFFGNDCSLSESELITRISTREVICKTLFENLNHQDVSSDVVSSRAVIIAKLFQDMTQISDTAFEDCSAVLVRTVDKLPICKGYSANKISNAFSKMLDRDQSEIAPTLLSDISATMNTVAEACQSSIGIGEIPYSVASKNMDISTSMNNKHSFGLGNSSYKVPPLSFAPSDLDNFLNVSKPSLSIDASQLSSSNSLGVTLIQYAKNPKGRRLNSSSLNIEMNQYSTSLTQNSRRLKSEKNHLVLKILLQNKEPVTYIDIESEVVEAKCLTPKGISYEFSIDCNLSGYTHIFTCPSNDRGIHKLTCPRIISQPQCQHYNGSAYVEDKSCEVMDYSDTSTTCHCLSQAIGESYSQRYLSSSQINTEYTS